MSKIEVNTVAPQCGTTLTLGESGDTVTLGAGASQSGFGRTGTVDWQTTIKTANFYSSVWEKDIFVIQQVELYSNLPAPSAGDIVAFARLCRRYFSTNNLTVSEPNGSEINGGNSC